MSAVEQKEVSNTEASSHNSGKPNGESKNGGQQHQNPEKPIMVARNKTGIVKWFSFKNGYGFITVDDDGDDIFVHRSEFIREGAREVFYHVDVGDKLEFDIINRAKGREAVAVTGPNGVRIPGSPAGFSHRRRNQNSERRGRNVEDHYEDAQEGDEPADGQHPNGNAKKRGARGGRRRNASGEGRENEPAGGENAGGEANKDKGARRNRPRRNPGGRGPRGPRGNSEQNDQNNSDNQQENVAPAQ